MKAIEVVKTRLGEFDTSGRRRPVPTDEIVRVRVRHRHPGGRRNGGPRLLQAPRACKVKEAGTLEVDRYSLETSRERVLRRRRPHHRRLQRLQRHGLRQEGGAQHRQAADGREALRRASGPSSSTRWSRRRSRARPRRHVPGELPAADAGEVERRGLARPHAGRGHGRDVPLPALRHPRRATTEGGPACRRS